MSDTDFNGSHILLHETANVAKLLMKNDINNDTLVNELEIKKKN